MGVLKGQNLRIFINGVCVGASTSCTVHLAAQTEDSSTKDSTGMWAESTVTGLSWDASVDALVTDTSEASQQRSNNGKIDYAGDSSLLEFEYDGNDYTAIPLAGGPGIDGTAFAEGETLVTATISGADIADSTHLCLFYSEDGTPDGTIELASDFGGPSGNYTVDPGDWDFTNTSIMFFAVKKIFQDVRSDAVLNATFTNEGRSLEDLMDDFGSTVTVRFSQAGGMNNRHQGGLIMKGTAIVSDLQVTAQNRNNSQYTCQLQGVGDLELED